MGKNNKCERTHVVLWTETNAQPPALHTPTPMRMHVARMRRRSMSNDHECAEPGHAAHEHEQTYDSQRDTE